MTTPTDVTYTLSTTVISSAHMNGINDWVFGWYGVLGEVFTAAAARTALVAAKSGDNIDINSIIPPSGIGLRVGTTSAIVAGGEGVQIGVSGVGAIATARNSTATSTHFNFYNPNGIVGVITTAGSGTTYSTSSDYRLKDNQQILTGSGEFIDALIPKTWTWKVDGSAGCGFIAHELQAVSPSSVVGEKDATDEDGTPVYQSVGYGSSEIIANLVAEVQELRKRVSSLENLG